MHGLIPTKIELRLDSSVERVRESLLEEHAGLKAYFTGQHVRIVNDPGARQHGTIVLEGYLIPNEGFCVFSGKVRWSRIGQFCSLIASVFLTGFCFVIPALMVRSVMMGTATSNFGHPLLIPFLWAVITFTPFFFLFRYLFKSHRINTVNRISRITK